MNNKYSKYEVSMIKKFGFTLAEVLITLGIIGIVAAMTLPTLILKHNKQITETALKKFYTTFNQAILISVNENGPVESWTDYFLSLKMDDDGEYIEQADDIDKAFQKYLAPYMKITDKKEVTDGGGYRRFLYFLPDGSAFAYQRHSVRDIAFFPKNAQKCIIKSLNDSAGSCLFMFNFYPIDKTTYWRYLYKKGLEPYLFEWDGQNSYLYDSSSYGCANSTNHLYCTAIIQLNGWKVPDDYPRQISY